jgi:hypothetical protein
MVCKIGTYEKFKNIKLPEGEKAGIFIRSISPIFLWVPDVMNEYLKK